MTNKSVIRSHETPEGEPVEAFRLMNRRRFLTTAALATGALASFPSWAQENLTEVSLSFGTAMARTVPRDYLGLSYETAQLGEPDYFAADNRELVSLFRALSPEGVLRIGGNSSEFCWWKTGAAELPPELPESAHGADNWMPHAFTAIEPVAVDRLAGFLKATGWKAIYGLNLGTGTPGRDAEEAARLLRSLATDGDVVLLKASRSSGLERVGEALRAN